MAVLAGFALSKLHKAILYHPLMVTLLISVQRASKAWRNFITASPTLQTELFIRLIIRDTHPSVAVSIDDRHDAADLIECPAEAADNVTDVLSPLAINPLLAENFSP